MFFAAHKEILALEQSWKTILDEMPNLESFVPWEYDDFTGSWQVFPLVILGTESRSCSICPKTMEILRQIPGVITASYVSISGKTHIKAHHDYDKLGELVYRFHLGLNIPDGCRIRVGDETSSWQEGKFLGFDNRIEHEVWNLTGKSRNILLLDLKRDKHQSIADFKSVLGDQAVSELSEYL